MARKLNISYRSVIFLLAVSFMAIGCADNRGFQTKRLKTPAIFDQKPGGENQPETQPPQMTAPVLTPEEITERTDQAIENRTERISDSTFVYNEGGNETQVTESEIEEKKQELREKAITTMNLPADQQILKGLSLSLNQGATAGSIPLNIKGVVNIDGTLDFFTANLVLSKTDQRISGKASALQWVSNRSDVQTQISAYCNGAADAVCSEISVTVELTRGESEQVFVAQYSQTNEGFEISGSSTGLLSFDDASQSTSSEDEPAEDDNIETGDEQVEEAQGEDTPAEEAQPEETQTENTQSEEQQEAPAQQEVAVEETPAAQDQSQQQQQQADQRRADQQRRAEQARLARQAEQESMDALRKYQAEKAQTAAQQKRAEEMRRFRQADQQSMDNLRKYQAEKAQAAAATKTHRQAEQESMDALKKYQAQQEPAAKTHRQAEQESMDALKKYQAEQKRLEQLRQFRKAEQQSMEALRRQQQQKQERKLSLPELRRKAEDESMKELEYQRKIEKILKDNEDARSQEV